MTNQPSLHTKEKSKLSRYWKRYYKSTYRIVSFLLCTLLMVLFFPGNGRFNYEYELKRPWRYENIIAPFDFPILKESATVEAERDSLRKTALPYFVIDSVVEIELREQVHKMVRANSSKIRYYSSESVSSDTLSVVVEKCIYNRLLEVCRSGILETPQSEETVAETGSELMIIRGNIAEPYRFEDLYTLREAYSHVMVKSIADIRRFYGGAYWVRSMVEALPVSELLTPNVFYDERKSQSAMEERLKNIALFSGKVLTGQLIVSTGDIVDQHTALLLKSLKEKYETTDVDKDQHYLPLTVGKYVLFGGLMFSVFLFLYFFRRDYYRQLHCINLVLLLMTFVVCSAGFLVGRGINISFVIPYVVLPIMLRIFTDSRLAIYVHMVTILIISFFAYNSHLFVLLHIPAGLLACIALFHLNKRIQIFRCSVYMFIYYVVMYSSYIFWQKAEFVFDPYAIAMFGIGSVLMLLTYPFIYVVEKMFGFVSDVTLMELTDGNSALLRQLSEKAPGTFQHSMQVANLGQEIAYRIGANAMLVRAGALYHDIGKLLNPMFFSENQVKNVNPHDSLTYEQSAATIINHVRDGLRLAKKFKVPTQVRDIIASHHGTSVTRFFYISWCNEHPEEDPDLSLFTYAGPLPVTKEEAIIMMADAVEASSRSLTVYSDQAIDTLVEDIIGLQVAGNQFKKSSITFAEIDKAKSVLKEKLKNIYHARIQYPEALVREKENEERISVE